MSIKIERHYIVNNGEKLIYTHRNVKNFEVDLAQRYFQHKQQQYSVMLEKYKTEFVKNIQINQSTSQALNATQPENQQQLFDGIESSLAQTIEQYVQSNSQRLNELREQVNSVEINNSSDLIEFLEIINDAVNLLYGDQNALSVLLGEAISKNISAGQLSGKLVQQFGLQNKNGRLINVDKNSLSNLAAILARLSAKAEKTNITAEQLRGYLNNIFGTTLGEYAVAKGVQEGLNITDQLIDDFLVGTQVIKGISTKKQKNSNNNLTVSKPDVSIGGGKVKLTTQDGQNVTFINLGLSVKQYTGSANSVSVVTGKPFAKTMSNLFPQGKYYVYNTLGLLDETAELYTEMKKAILFNQASEFLGGTGGTNFAQYLVINGQLYSIYEILKRIKGYKGSGTNKIIDDVMSISVAKAGTIKSLRYQFGDTDSLEQAWLRNKAIHQAIGELTIHGVFNPNNFINFGL